LELYVFKGRVSSEIGSKAAEAAEAEARKLAIDKYGTYTSFREGYSSAE
jgi:hypothetical protein